jgi:hypothetical protein
MIGTAIVARFVMEGRKFIDEDGEDLRDKRGEIIKQGEKVAIMNNNLKLTRGKNSRVGVGIHNLGADEDHPEMNTFFVHLVTKYKDPQTGNIEEIEDQDIFQPLLTSEYFIKNNEVDDNILILLNPKRNTKQGTYIIDVFICRKKDQDPNNPNGYINLADPSECNDLTKTYTKEVFKIYAKVK